MSSRHDWDQSEEIVTKKTSEFHLPLPYHSDPSHPSTASFLEVGRPNPNLPTVVLLHGARFTAKDYKKMSVLQELKHRAGAHVVAVDLPGFGETKGPKIVQEAEKVAWLTAFLDTERLERVVLVAASMSGSYALPFLLSSPGRVAGFVAIAAVGIEEHGTEIRHRNNLNMPVLTVWGANDKPDGTRAKLYGWVFNKSTMEVIPGAGHACWYEKPEEFNDILTTWFLEHKEDFRGDFGGVSAEIVLS